MFWVPLLLLAWAIAGVAGLRLCRAAVREAAAGGEDEGRGLTLYEAAFLSGGPVRVADVTLVAMARQRRLLLAHTGWATVVDPCGRDDIERTVIGAIGPDGQSPIAPVRKAAAAAETVRALADRLVRAGLAVPEGDGRTVAEALRRTRLAAAAVAGLAAAALLVPTPSQMPRSLVALWFALPLVFTLGCLAIARFELSPASRWASPAGQRLLASVRRAAAGDPDDDRAYLTSVAVRGVRAAGGPQVRAAFAHREPHPEG
ncbi:TIGR04222 domain-containing membrane protein [Streptomyces sp. DH-12]|uniref:TIGR04222 domain-containing membrane protein n=1 Tax=unclassified Streptomyces TaxID=2593676 RepID=UPI000CCFA737|nr:TIGR04222 domain-containing membrane protein [Streptomyces sp. DH-12]PNV32149.1 TIGR04222 domain-containing membrane protein [Streptomyces sp. DH-12]